jgi:AbrB family looped-hinge helix DNA binding protein
VRANPIADVAFIKLIVKEAQDCQTYKVRKKNRIGEIMAQYEADVTVVSGKGQVVIPQSIRERLKIGPKTKLLVYGYGDAVIMKKMEIHRNLPDRTVPFSSLRHNFVLKLSPKAPNPEQCDRDLGCQ